MEQTLLNRFLGYVKINTMSNDQSTSFPSSTVQVSFAKELARECERIGLQDVTVDDYGYVFATLPGNIDKEVPVIGFIAHMDTVPDFAGDHVNPQIIENYKGGTITLNAAHNIVLSPAQFPILDTLVGEKLITTDGTTVLGSDDKAGIAEILTAMEYLIKHPEIKHGPIRVGFTPDEEIGRGVDFFDVKRFNAQFAYTIDGCNLGELQYENFNAASATVHFNGVSVHPGSAKGKMVNSMSIACEYQSLLPAMEVPEHTEGHEGFYHLHDMKGSIEDTTLHYIIRDHDKDNFETRKQTMQGLVHVLNQKYGEGTATTEIKDSYFNMSEVIKDHPEVMELAKKAFKEVGVEPLISPIRGGTDGARLSFMGLPCPNIFTGGYNCHGKYEFAVVSHMLQATKIIIKIAELGTHM